MKARGIAAALAASTTLVAGCGDASGHAGPDIPYPFGGAVYVPAEQQQILKAAEEELVVECMRDRGMAYVPEPVADHGREDSAASLYGLLSPHDAWLHGYGMGEELASPSTGPTGANEAAREALSEDSRRRWDEALLGTPSSEKRIEVDGTVFVYRADGCVTLARHKLFGRAWDRLNLSAQVAMNRVTTAVWRDHRVTTAVDRWSSCMAQQGYDLATPTDARAAVDTAYASAAAGDQAAFSTALRLEHETAIADADCQASSGLWKAVGAAQETAQSEVPSGLINATTSLPEARAAALATARRVLGSS